MNETPLNHPGDETLRALSLGQLTEAELTLVSAHLGDCPACCRRIDQLATDDRLQARLQQIVAIREEGLVTSAQRRPAVRALRQAHEAGSATRMSRPAPRQVADYDFLAAVAGNPAEREEQAHHSLGFFWGSLDAGLTVGIGKPSKAGDRYQLFGEIARGGMGAVLRGRDVDLGRDLAVKVLLEKHATLPEMSQRFVEEARICGQLQHPGVVPVYDIGRFGDRPFFTMKLVQGMTLAAKLDERKQPTDDRPHLLNIALQVAQALAYAHAKGVIHRDLKPANIMVGAFGEVQVMDWGLAKVLADGGDADGERAGRQHPPGKETLIRTARTGGTETETGSILGTPAYMPPEQASGDIARLDRRADVFGLGAILCEILTGKPPYMGWSGEEVHRKAANGDLADAYSRLEGCGADPELIVLTKWCLSPRALDRPEDARGVADGLSKYLNGVQERLQATERERAVAVVRAGEERKRRKVQLALALAVVGLLLGGGAFAFWRNEQAQIGRERDARNAEAVAALLGQCEEALRANDAAKAAVALEAAKKRAAEGGAQEQAERLDRLDADLALVRDLDAVDQFRWTVVEKKFPGPAVVAKQTWEALRRFGADPDEVSVDEAAARVSASVAHARVVAALDRLLGHEKSAVVRDLLRRVDAEPYRDEVRDAVLANDGAKTVELAGRKAALEQPPGFVANLGESGSIPVERRRQLLQAAVSQRPEDLSLLMTLGLTYSTNQKVADEGRLWFQAAVAAAPANAAAHNNLGVALLDKGQLEEAIACFRKAVKINPKLAGAHNNLGIALNPSGDGLYFNLGTLLRNKGQLEEAIACFQQAIAIDPKHAVAHSNLGLALRARGRVEKDKGQLEGAIAYCRKATDLDPNLAGLHYNLGLALEADRRRQEAVACYEKAIALDPKDARPYSCLGAILCDVKRDYDGAIDRFNQAIALDPKPAIYHDNLGIALSNRGRLKEAIASHEKAIALDPKYAPAHNSLGTILCNVNRDYAGAISHFNQATALDPTFAVAHVNLGIALASNGQVDEAITSWKQAIALDPTLAMAHANLGIALVHEGQVDEAIACFKKAIVLAPKFASFQAYLADAERLAAARDKLAAFQKGTYTPATPSERLDMVEWCRVKKLHHTAAELYAAAFAAYPMLADDLKGAHRYSAARRAALAAAGQGEDVAKIDEKERTRLRQQALTWLRADLDLWAKHLETGQPADRVAGHQTLKHWQQDPDLAGLRDAAALAKLPAEEQKAWTQLWADVAALLKKAEEKPN